MVFLFGRDRRDIAIELLHLGKDFVEAEKRGLVRVRLEFVAEGVIYKRALAFQLLFRGLGHLAYDGFRHPFAPLVNRKRKRRRRYLREHVVRQIERDAIAIAHRIKDHLAYHHAAGTVETFNAELFEGTAERGCWRHGGLFTLHRGIECAREQFA